MAEYNNPRTWTAKDAQRIASTRDLLTRLAERPGMSAAGTLLYFPYHTKLWQSPAFAEGTPTRAGDESIVYYNLFAGDYFAAMGIPLLSAPMPTDAEMWEHDNRVVVVNRAFARKLFGSESAVGKRFRNGEDTTWLSVIGVVGDVRQRRLDDAPRAEFYRPFSSMPMPFGTLVVRRAPGPGSSVTDAAFAATVAASLREIEPALAAADVQSLSQFVATSETARRGAMATLSMFSIITVALAVLGIYGMMAYAVAERTPEIGVRMALGATSSEVARMFTLQGIRSAAIGIVTGLCFAILLWRTPSALLYGVRWIDSTAFALVPIALLVLAALASGIPALRASRISPMRALRDG